MSTSGGTAVGHASASRRRRRAAVALNLALALVAGGAVAYAVTSEGYRSHRADLNDGGVWVTNSKIGYYGRVNKPIGQLDGAAYARWRDNLDIVQQGAAVVGLNVSERQLVPLDPSTVTTPDEGRALVARGAQVQLGGGSLAVLDPRSGDLRAMRVDPEVGVTSLAEVDDSTRALATLGEGSSVAVSQTGQVVAVSGSEDEVLRLSPTRDGFGTPAVEHLPTAVGLSTQVTTVGDRTVVLDATSGDLIVMGGARAVVEPGSVLQQPGPDADSVLVATPSALIAVSLEDGEARTLGQVTGGLPTAPVRLGECSYGAWSGGRGAVVTQCGSAAAGVATLSGPTSDLVFRVNRGQILLNDRLSGAVWNIDDKRPTRIEEWQAQRDKNDEQPDHSDDDKFNGDRRPPKAKPDRFGARPGRVAVLHPLDNDSASQGRLLAISSVEQVSNVDTALTISPDGQTIQIVLPPEAAGTTSFEYYVSDGRPDVTAHATISVTARPHGNDAPRLRRGFEPKTWPVAPGGTIKLPVLPDWRDPTDSDALSLVSATVPSQLSGAIAQTTADGRIRFTAPAKPGPVKVSYTVTDGLSAPVEEQVDFRVLNPVADEPVAATAEPDIVSAEAGRWTTIRPLANDLPGADPLNPRAELALAGKIAAVSGAQVRTDLAEGTVSFRATTAKSFNLVYDAAYGDAQLAHGDIRVDVRPRDRRAPVAMPDTATIYGQTATLVDVLANDTDPAGGLLVVTGAAGNDQVDVAVVDGRWVRVSARSGTLRPNPQVVHYTVSNGVKSSPGEVEVTQRPIPSDNAPVTEVDKLTVRAGAGAAIAVLDNDFSPSGDQLSLVGDLAGEGSGHLSVVVPSGEAVDPGQAFVSGRMVRYVAPPDLKRSMSFEIDYVAANTDGETSPGRVDVTVIPVSRPNRAPEAPLLESRTVAGDTVTIKLPGSGIDPDGDAVSLVGLASAPKLGRVVKIGANAIEYQSYPHSAGTDEFDYLITDGRGATSAGSVRVAVAPPGTPQPPLALPDEMTAEPDRLVTIDPLANDLVGASDQATIELIDPPGGVTLESPTGPVTIRTPSKGKGHTLDVVYRLSNGVASSLSTITVHTATPYNNPPVVLDAYGAATATPTVEVDVLETAYDPDGPSNRLRVTKVFAPTGVRASVAGGTITVARGDEPLVIPFRVEDRDGGAAIAHLYVPPRRGGLPYVKDGALITLKPGASLKAALADYVVSPSGGVVRFTAGRRIEGSPTSQVLASVTSAQRFTLRAANGYVGPGAVAFEVTDQATDAAGRSLVLSVPVEVGTAAPILNCPTSAITVPQGGSVSLDIARVCHVWTADPAAADGLSYVADWKTSVPGLAIVQPRGATIELAADGSARAGSEAVLLVSTSGSQTATLRIRVGPAKPPTLAPVQVRDLKPGDAREVDLSTYLTSTLPSPSPELVSVARVSGTGVTATDAGGARLKVAATAQASSSAQFRVVVTDQAGSSDPGRQASNLVTVNLLGPPDRPQPPTPSGTVLNEAVRLSWRAPAANGSPIDYYEVTASNGRVQRCPSTACEVKGLTNGTAYTFTLRAHNAVGWSEPSAPSRPAAPDGVPGTVSNIKTTKIGDGILTLVWTPPTLNASHLTGYLVTWPGGRQFTNDPSPLAVVDGLDNNRGYRFTIRAINKVGIGPPVTSGEFHTYGPPGRPNPPRVTELDPGSDPKAHLLVDWDPVDQNGDLPPLYTLQYDGTSVAGCTGQLGLTCTLTGIPYDGDTHQFKVQVTTSHTGAGAGITGDSTPWRAVAAPLPWGDWTVEPTGQTAQASLDFTVPDSRGRDSDVTVIVDGSPKDSGSWRGVQSRNVAVPDNDEPHTIKLKVCNESGACTFSSQKDVQTYGPLSDSAVVKVTPNDSGRMLGYTVTIDANGAPVQVVMTSSLGRPDQTVDWSGPDRTVIDVDAYDVGYNAEEDFTVKVIDPVRHRGSGSKTVTGTTGDPPPAVVVLSRGPLCDDSTSGNPCHTGGSEPDCTDPSCGFIQLDVSNFTGQVTCTIHRPGIGDDTVSGIPDNSTKVTDLAYGVPGNNVTVHCSRGSRQDDDSYSWPN